MKRSPINLSPSLDQMIGSGPVSTGACAWFIELTHLGSIEVPFGDAYLWIVCEQGGGYFSKTDYLSRATYFASEACAQEFLTVFPFIQGKVIAGQLPGRRHFSNSVDDPKPMAVIHPFWLAVQSAWEEKAPAVKKKVYHELRLQRARQLLGHATSFAAVTPEQQVLTLDDLFTLMRTLVHEMLPEQDIPALIRDKAIRFQCRNKADIDADGKSLADDDRPSHPGEVSRRGDVIPNPQRR